MPQGTDRLYAGYHNINAVELARNSVLSGPAPKLHFSSQQEFLNEVVQQLIDQGRDVYISTAQMGLDGMADIKVPAIRERSRILSLLRKVLYRSGDNYEKVEDAQVRAALIEADKKHPYSHRAGVPVGTPL